MDDLEPEDPEERDQPPPLRFDLMASVALPPDAEEGPFVEWLTAQTVPDPDDGAGDLFSHIWVFNGVHAWLFLVAHRTDEYPFFGEWVAREWRLKPRQLKKAGWPGDMTKAAHSPVLKVEKGRWPLDPRLHPGNPPA